MIVYIDDVCVCLSLFLFSVCVSLGVCVCVLSLLIQFPPEMDGNWVRYGLAKLGQISELPNWQRMLFCAYTTQLLHSTGEVCWNNKDSYFIWFEFVCRNSGQMASRRSWKRSCLGLEYTSKMLTVGSLVGAQLG